MGPKTTPRDAVVATASSQNTISEVRKSSRPQVGLINDKEGASVKKGGSRWLTFKIVAVILTSCIIAMVVVICAVILSRDSAQPVPTAIMSSTVSSPIYTDDPPYPDEELSIELNFVSRPEWAARQPVSPLYRLSLPARYVIISETETFSCETQTTCTFRVQYTQAVDIETKNLSDIRYNFLIGGDDLVYVGRGWDRVGAHSYGHNRKSIGISFIGTFNDVLPPMNQLLVARELIKRGVEEGKIAPDYKLLGYRQLSTTRNPGDALYSAIKTWRHWSRTL